MRIRRNSIATVAMAMALGALTVVPAWAQTDTPSKGDLEEILVTGSRLVTDATSPSPVSVITAETIRDTGQLAISEVLRKDPALGSNSRGPGNTLNGGGSLGANLRNLGNQRTLTLVNGRRFATFADELGNSTQDIGAIPTGMIKRIDILRDGASTAYGADAVAGVVNFILRDDLNGAEAEGYFGESGQGDGMGYRGQMAVGTVGSRGAVMANFQVQKFDDIPQSNRKWATNLIQSLAGNGTFNSSNTPGGVVTQGTTPIACYPLAGGTTNQLPNCPRYDSTVEASLQLGSRVISVGSTAHYDLTDTTRLDFAGFFSDRKSFQSIAATPIDTTTSFGPFPSGFTIPASSPNNPYGVPIGLRWRLSQYGARPNVVDSKQFWGTLGLSGTLFNRFDWQVAHTYSETSLNSQRYNSLNVSNLFNILNSSVCAADRLCSQVGAIGDIRALLTRQASLTQAQRDYLLFDSVVDSRFVSQQSTATVRGSLFSLPYGEVKAALGYEHREETAQVTPDAVTASGASTTLTFPTDGGFSTNEGFGEMQVPLLANLPFAKSVDLNLQGRFSDFSNFGTARTYKAGVNYTVNDDVRVRADYGTSFRAPTVLEAYGGGVGATGSISDPCNSGTGSLRATNPAVNANCLALGAPANFQQNASSLPTRSGGNPNLRPEKGRTFTAGVVLTPSYVPNLTLTADYYNFRISNAIGTNDLTALLANCYRDPNLQARAANSADSCFGLSNRVNGQLGRLNNYPINIGTARTQGIDLSAAYRFDKLVVIPGSLGLSARVTRLISFNSGNVGYAGTFVGGVGGSDSYPRWSGYFTADYRLNEWAFKWETQYVSAMRDFSYGTSVPTTNFLYYSGTPDYFVHNILLKYSPMPTLDLGIGINNLFDKDPPYSFVLQRNALTSTFDSIGRYFFATVKKTF
ncbi:MAG: TonB-dependent receptor [Rhodospirillales bacterium]|nr:TonB-dependent receptor [Rhodospirillales bacterium]